MPKTSKFDEDLNILWWSLQLEEKPTKKEWETYLKKAISDYVIKEDVHIEVPFNTLIIAIEKAKERGETFVKFDIDKTKQREALYGKN